MKKGLQMKQMTKSALCTLVLGMGINGYAQGEQTIQFAPAHPASCTEKKTAPIAEASKPAATPKLALDSDGDGVVDDLDKCPDTPHGYKVDPTGCPVSVTLHLNFAFNSSIIPASADGDVAKLARVMKENLPVKAIIIGHTDSVGTDEYNQKLSEKRAQSLAKTLTESGIDANRMNVSGKGEKAPIATNATAAGRAENRRIEVKLQ
jgi:OOP family OmpA-OmpF porin